MKALFGWLMVLALTVSSSAAFAAKLDEAPLFSQAELDQMLAPIALYPDQLLSQILMAATYPLEVVQAARLQRSNPNLQGQDAVRAAAGHGWDPSVQSLLAFPNVLQQMDADLDWTERLGDAFLAQQDQVMDTVQALRNRAYAAGNLNTDERIRVVRERDVIMLQPARSNLFYVPYYDPLSAYGSWWWPQYRPVSWNLWPGYELGFAYGNRGTFYWGSGISLGINFFFGDWDWPTRRVRVVPRAPFYYHRPAPVNHVWIHEYRHRRGHPYRHLVVAQRYVPQTITPLPRRSSEEYRGNTSRPRSNKHQELLIRPHAPRPSAPNAAPSTRHRSSLDRRVASQPPRITAPARITDRQRVEAPRTRPIREPQRIIASNRNISNQASPSSRTDAHPARYQAMPRSAPARTFSSRRTDSAAGTPVRSGIVSRTVTAPRTGFAGHERNMDAQIGARPRDGQLRSGTARPGRDGFGSGPGRTTTNRGPGRR